MRGQRVKSVALSGSDRRRYCRRRHDRAAHHRRNGGGRPPDHRGGTPGIGLMENAGRAVADAVVAAHPRGAPTIVRRGRPGQQRRRRLCRGAHPGRARLSGARLLLLGDRDRLKGDAARGRRGAGAGRSSRRRPRRSHGADVIVDALFGAGLDRPVEGAARAMIEAINAAGVPVDRGRSAERHQRQQRRGDGRGGQGQPRP